MHRARSPEQRSAEPDARCVSFLSTKRFHFLGRDQNDVASRHASLLGLMSDRL